MATSFLLAGDTWAQNIRNSDFRRGEGEAGILSSQFSILNYRRGVAGGLIGVWCPRWFGGAACAAETAALQGIPESLW